MRRTNYSFFSGFGFSAGFGGALVLSAVLLLGGAVCPVFLGGVTVRVSVLREPLLVFACDPVLTAGCFGAP